MLRKWFQIILTIMFIPILVFPNAPAAALGSLPPDVKISYHSVTGMASFIGSPDSGRPIRTATAQDANATTQEVARSFLVTYGNQFGVVDAQKNLSILRETKTDTGNSTVRFQQTYQGIPVLAGEMIVHMDSSKNVLSASGEILPAINLDVIPGVDETTAMATALEATAKENGVNVEDLQASAPELWIYNPALLTPYAGQTVLGWRIEVTPKTGLAPVRQLVLVEAKRGGVSLSFNQLDYARNRLTYNAGGGSTLPGTLVCNESNPACSGGSTDAVKAHLYAGQTYDFYMTYHGRDSINGAGMNLVSTVNFDDLPADGLPFENAFWNGAQMVYGPSFSSADDVVAHELTHGVTEFESGLFYYYQSGAINESFSDVWGEFMDLTNAMGTDTVGTRWQMGEDLPVSIGVIRNMQDPTIYGDPDKMTSVNYYTGPDDNGGVHWNSGINNKAAYLMTDGATFNTKTVTGLGITKVAKIYYYAQANLLVSGADYSDLYYALQTSCAAQIGTAGITSGDCQEVLDAVNAVEMNLQPVAGFNTETAACDVVGKYPANRFYDNLEAGSGNWVFTTTSVSPRWRLDSPVEYGPFAHSGQHFLYADDYPAAATDASARMTISVTVPPSGKMLFHHAYDLEGGFDGGVLEYSTNGGGAWTDAGSLMDGNGYDGALATGSNPLGGRQAFTGVSHGYIATRLNLSSLAGQNVMFRFRMGLDGSVYNWGWWLDDVQIYECLRFSDVPSNYWSYTSIEKLAANSITGGCSTGFYCPTTPVTRAQMAIFLLRGMHGSTYTPPAATGTKFNDVPLGTFGAAWIEQLAVEGITSGCGGGNYCPTTSVSRAQMAIFLVRAKHGIAFTPPTATGLFTDVPVGSFGADYIEQLSADAITNGCGGGKFCPNTTVNRDSMAVFLVKTFNLP